MTQLMSSPVVMLKINNIKETELLFYKNTFYLYKNQFSALSATVKPGDLNKKLFCKTIKKIGCLRFCAIIKLKQISSRFIR